MKLENMPVIPALALGLFAVPALAQTPQGASSAEETTARLNREQAEFARKQMADNAASQEAHDAGARREADFEAEKARLAKQHEQAMASWQADVDACKGGDRSRCSAPPVE